MTMPTPPGSNINSSLKSNEYPSHLFTKARRMCPWATRSTSAGSPSSMCGAWISRIFAMSVSSRDETCCGDLRNNQHANNKQFDDTAVHHHREPYLKPTSTSIGLRQTRKLGCQKFIDVSQDLRMVDFFVDSSDAEDRGIDRNTGRHRHTLPLHNHLSKYPIPSPCPTPSPSSPL